MGLGWGWLGFSGVEGRGGSWNLPTHLPFFQIPLPSCKASLTSPSHSFLTQAGPWAHV